MTFNADDVWKKLREGGEARAGEQQSRQQENYEGTVVRALIKSTGVAFDIRQARQDSLSNEATDRIDLAWFARHYPRFPIRLRAAKIAWAHKALAALFVGFSKSPIYNAITEFVEEAAVDLEQEAVGIVFPVIKHGDMVLHSLRYDAAWISQEQPKPRDRASFYFDTDIQDQCFVLETLPRMLKRIGTSWH